MNTSEFVDVVRTALIGRVMDLERQVYDMSLIGGGLDELVQARQAQIDDINKALECLYKVVVE